MHSFLVIYLTEFNPQVTPYPQLPHSVLKEQLHYPKEPKKLDTPFKEMCRTSKQAYIVTRM